MGCLYVQEMPPVLLFVLVLLSSAEFNTAIPLFFSINEQINICVCMVRMNQLFHAMHLIPHLAAHRREREKKKKTHIS
jgi:hypothetical protein